MNRFLIHLVLLLFIHYAMQGQHYSPGYRDADPDWLDQLIFKGSVWQPRMIPVTGHEFFLSADYFDGQVTVAGFRFEELKIKYDIYSDELIVLWNDVQPVVLERAAVDGFTIGAGNASMIPGKKFINLRDHFRGLTGYVEVIHQGRSMVVARHTKTIAKNSSLTSYAQYKEKTRYWFISGTECLLIRNRRSFLHMLGEHENDVKRFIRQNHLNVSNFYPQGYGQSAAFFDQLTTREEE